MTSAAAGRGGEGRAVRRLEDALVDQIAAGEVVERPASVVKELVENALDAEARRIQVDVREGGAAWIAVTDDGHGMSPQDARLALTRHATSKIRTKDDLQSIHSFGFRGEALPAIASVSRLRLATRARGADAGTELRVDAGRIVEEREAGGPEGTRIEVADLFASVPARRKFLKRPATEWGHIADWLTRSALALPGVHFEVRRDERPAWIWPATDDPLDRIAAVLSERDAAALVAVHNEDSVGHLEAFVSSPEHTRANAQGLYLFVNGRPVRDPLLRSAVLQVYRDWLPRGRFPTAILFLTVDPAQVDVNVHPAKWEVRFAEPQAVHQLVRRSLRDAISERRWLGGTSRPAEASGAVPDRLERTVAPAAPDAAAPTAAGTPDRRPGDWVFAESAPGPELVREAEQPTLAGHRAPDTSASASAGANADVHGRAIRFADRRLVGQLLASYLVVEGDDGLLLVDQHAAHERVLYERLRAAWLERGVERQALLVPATVELRPAEAAALAAAGERVERLGFEVEPFGETAVVVRAVPALLGARDPASLVSELAEELAAETAPDASGDDAVRLLRAADRIFATLACHSARRFGDVLEPAEQRSLLESLDAIPWAPTCPHGRPVAVAFDRAEIERRFGRR